MSRPMRRIVIGAGVVAVAAVVTVVVVVQRGPASSAADGTGAPVPEETVPVSERDLVQREEVSGQLGYGDRSVVSGHGGGVITALPPEGSTLERGASMWETDGHAGPALLYGDRPQWRRMAAGMDDGLDVRLLEENLAALGYGDALTVDDEWTSATTKAVKAWQEARGLDDTGVLELGDLVVQPGPVRVAEHKVSPGATADAEVYEISGTAAVVSVDLDSRKAQIARSGDPVEIELPDGSTVPGTIFTVGTVVHEEESQQGGTTSTVEVTIGLDQPVPGAPEDAPVTVGFVKQSALGVVAVPVEALLALSEGGYALERVRDGVTELVGVQLGDFADGYVAVEGDVRPGDAVVVPA